MKAIEQYFHVVLCIMLYKVVLTFKSMDETLVCDHSNENYVAVLSCGAILFSIVFKLEFQFFFNIPTDVNFVFGDDVYPLVSKNNSILNC